MSELPLTDRLAALREAFDHSFAEAPVEYAQVLESFVLARVAGETYALRLSEIAGLHRDVPVTPVPSLRRELLGIAAYRGTIAAVFDLAALLGHESRASRLWHVVARAQQPIAFAFEQLSAHTRVPQDHVKLHAAPQGLLHGVVTTGGNPLPLVSVGALVAAVLPNPGTSLAQQR